MLCLRVRGGRSSFLFFLRERLALGDVEVVVESDGLFEWDF